MVLPIKRQITLNDNTTFFVSYLNVIYFDGQRLTDLPYNLDLDWLEKKMKEDEKLNELVRTYKDLSLVYGILHTKEIAYETILNYTIANTKVFGYGEFTASHNCGIEGERTHHGFEYYTQHFWLKVELDSTKYNFGCFVKKLDEAINKIDSSASIHVQQIGDLIAIDFNSTNVFMSRKYTLRTILSLFFNLLYNSVYLEENVPIKNLQDLINVFKDIKEIREKANERIDMFFEIANRIQELAKASRC